MQLNKKYAILGKCKFLTCIQMDKYHVSHNFNSSYMSLISVSNCFKFGEQM